MQQHAHPTMHVARPAPAFEGRILLGICQDDGGGVVLGGLEKLIHRVGVAYHLFGVGEAAPGNGPQGVAFQQEDTGAVIRHHLFQVDHDAVEHLAQVQAGGDGGGGLAQVVGLLGAPLGQV